MNKPNLVAIENFLYVYEKSNCNSIMAQKSLEKSLIHMSVNVHEFIKLGTKDNLINSNDTLVKFLYLHTYKVPIYLISSSNNNIPYKTFKIYTKKATFYI